MPPTHNKPSTINSTQTLYPSLTQEQNLQIFKIYCQQAENKRAVATKKHVFKLKYIERKSNAQITLTAPTPTLASSQAPFCRLREEDNITGEIFQEIQSLNFCYADLF